MATLARNNVFGTVNRQHHGPVIIAMEAHHRRRKILKICHENSGIAIVQVGITDSEVADSPVCSPSPLTLNGHALVDGRSADDKVRDRFVAGLSLEME
jgi:hypothetical protein